jgi:hypothetical protein
MTENEWQIALKKQAEKVEEAKKKLQQAQLNQALAGKGIVKESYADYIKKAKAKNKAFEVENLKQRKQNSGTNTNRTNGK